MSAEWKVQHCENSDLCRYNRDVDDEIGTTDVRKLEHSECRGSCCRDYMARKNPVR